MWWWLVLSNWIWPWFDFFYPFFLASSFKIKIWFQPVPSCRCTPHTRIIVIESKLMIEKKSFSFKRKKMFIVHLMARIFKFIKFHWDCADQLFNYKTTRSLSNTHKHPNISVWVNSQNFRFVDCGWRFLIIGEQKKKKKMEKIENSFNLRVINFFACVSGAQMSNCHFFSIWKELTKKKCIQFQYMSNFFFQFFFCCILSSWKFVFELDLISDVHWLSSALNRFQ